MRILFLLIALFLTYAAPAQPITSASSDSLTAKRNVLTTAIYRNNERLANVTVRDLFQSNSKARAKHSWGSVLKPIGPLMIVSGLAIGYLGVRGETRTGFVRGVGTKTQPNVPDIQVQYTKRSLSKLVAGLGLFVGGLYLIERSNELTAASVKLYNAKLAPIRSSSRLENLKLGINASGNLSLQAKF